jgi:hypothetical protein
MLIEVKPTLRLGDKLVPTIFMSNGTHLSNFAAKKKEWPDYMTIGCLSSKFRQMPSTHTVVMVDLQPIVMKCHIFAPKRLHEQHQPDQEVLKEVLRWVHQPLTFQQHPNAERRYIQRSLRR